MLDAVMNDLRHAARAASQPGVCSFGPCRWWRPRRSWTVCADLTAYSPMMAPLCGLA